jgi:hypothetical protein
VRALIRLLVLAAIMPGEGHYAVPVDHESFCLDHARMERRLREQLGDDGRAAGQAADIAFDNCMRYSDPT